MTTRTELLALAERVEKADGPDRELGNDILSACARAHVLGRNQPDPTTEPPLHYSRQPLTTIVDNRQLSATEEGGHFGDKPRGLWVSVGPAWREWCEAEGYNLPGLTHVTKITLAPTANRLVFNGWCINDPGAPLQECLLAVLDYLRERLIAEMDRDINPKDTYDA